ncbi:MAG: tetratricopeptide repeat protein [Alphaproteobacteria bacterium]|nr:tetratricopeptide repeat protein [Alphaproteobacteria bacterium]
MTRTPADTAASGATALEGARQALRAGAFDQAAAACRDAIAIGAPQRDAMALLGMVELAQRRGEPALQWCWRAVALDPVRASLHELIGRAGLMAKRAALAASAYRNALALDPGRARAHAGLGAALADLGRDDGAVDALQRAATLDLGDWTCRQLLALALRRLGRNEEAISAFADATRLKPDDWKLRLQSGHMLRELDRSGAALGALQAACVLQPSSVNALLEMSEELSRLDRTSDAADALASACDLSPADAELRFRLGKLLMQSGRSTSAALALTEATRLRPDNGRYEQLLAEAHLANGAVDNALNYWCRSLRHNREIIARQRSFYFAQYLVDAVGSKSGRRAALEAAMAMMDAVGDRPEAFDLARHRPETKAFLDALRSVPPWGPIDECVAALLDGRPLEALRSFAASAMPGVPVPDKYLRVLEHGPDAGHPGWHLANPFYYLWKCGATTPGQTAQELWQSNPVFNRARGVDDLAATYDGWLAAEVPARDVLRDFVARHDPRGLRILDLGCGDGSWLYFMATECGVPRQNLFGCDLHEARVEAARKLLNSATFSAAMSRAGDVPFRETNIFQADLLTWDADAFVRRHGTIDLVTMFSVAVCFDDRQLDRCLMRVAQLGTRHVLEVSALDTWDLQIGRPDLAANFRRQGYRPAVRNLVGEPLKPRCRDELFLPRKYWPAMQIGIYERC